MTPEEESRMVCTVRDQQLKIDRLSNELEWARKALADVHSGRVYSELLKAVDYWRGERDKALGIEPHVYPHKLCPKCHGDEKGCPECLWTGKWDVWLRESGRNFESEQLHHESD